MDGTTDGELSDDWFLDSEGETQKLPLSTRSDLKPPNQELCAGHGEASTSASPHSMLIGHFGGMGFPKHLVTKAVEENGEGNTEAILETLLSYSTLSKSPSECGSVPHDLNFSESEDDFFNGFSDEDGCLMTEENVEQLPDKDKMLSHLVEMGFPVDEASSAIDACGPGTSITELMDFISAAQMAKISDTHIQEPHYSISNDELGPGHNHGGLPTVKKKRKKLFEVEDTWERKQDTWRRKGKELRKNQKTSFVHGEEAIHLPKHMIGFGVPNEPRPMFRRTLPEEAIGPPYFYYENVACAPKGAWDTISRFLFDIEPEFVDSVHFCAAARKRGYVHNLPIYNRYPLQPIPPLTIQEAFPHTKRWWPSFDCRTKLNCLNTCYASARLTERIRTALENWDNVPPLRTQKYVLAQCRKWNLVWIGKNRAAPLEPDEIEMLLGYPRNHTRGGGTSRNERYRALGNSFQVDTVAYHLSALKNIFPQGITVLSLFSGIGGAEIALHRLGIPLKTLVTVEISEVSRNIFRSWWEQTNQKGNLIELEDVQQLSEDKLEQFVHAFGGFDLIVGGSPCNNLTGSNRISRDGLQGTHSILFYDYFRILNTVKSIMGNTL